MGGGLSFAEHRVGRDTTDKDSPRALANPLSLRVLSDPFRARFAGGIIKGWHMADNNLPERAALGLSEDELARERREFFRRAALVGLPVVLATVKSRTVWAQGTGASSATSLTPSQDLGVEDLGAGQDLGPAYEAERKRAEEQKGF